MKVKSIKPHQKYEITDVMLSSKNLNDVILNMENILVEFEDMDYFLLFNHILTQNVFRNNVDYHAFDNTLRVSLSEAICFINTATPPPLRKLIPESINSYDDIISILNTMLIEKETASDFNLTTFYDIIGLKDLCSGWSDNKTKQIADILISENKSTDTILCYQSFDTDAFQEFIFISNKDNLEQLYHITQSTIISAVSCYKDLYFIKVLKSSISTNKHIDFTEYIDNLYTVLS